LAFDFQATPIALLIDKQVGDSVVTMNHQDIDKENNTTMDGLFNRKPSMAGTPHMTPSKARVNLGSHAKFYFKGMQSTGKRKNKVDLLMKGDDANFYLNFVNSTSKKKGDMSMCEDDTGTISIPPINLNNLNNSTMDASLLSLGSSSSEESDLLNKSTQSDTTELAPSTFVLAATSRQRIRQLSMGKTKKTPSKPPAAAAPAAAPAVKVPKSSPKVLQEKTNEADIASQNANSSPGRQSMKGASPSLRSRISASPKSLHKLTEDLKNSRMKRQEKREEDSKRRLSIGSDNSMLFTMNSRLEVGGAEMEHTISRMRLPPSINQTTGKIDNDKNKRESILSVNSEETGSTTDEIMKDVDDLFSQLNNTTAEVAIHSQQARRSSVTTRPSVVQQLLKSTGTESQTKDHTVASPNQEGKQVPSSIIALNQPREGDPKSPLTEMFDFPFANKFTNQESNNTASLGDLGDIFATQGSKDVDQRSVVKNHSDNKSLAESFSSPPDVRNSRTSFQLTSSALKSRVTPTKLTSTPQRISNPRLFDSPSRNTRSAQKEIKRNEDQTASIADLDPLKSDINLDNSSPQQNLDQQLEEVDGGMECDGGNTASIEDIGDLMNYLTQSSSQDVDSPPRETITNARDFDSPARNTRSARKEAMVQKAEALSTKKSEDDTTSIGNLGDILGTQTSATQSLVAAKGSPQSLVNPRTLDSPARNTRSARKENSIKMLEKKAEANSAKNSEGDTASIGDLGGILGTQTSATQSLVAAKGAPQSLVNPRTLDSPARNTRSAGKESSMQMSEKEADAPSAKNSEGDTASIGDLGDILDDLLDAVGSPSSASSSPQEMANPRALDSSTINTGSAEKEMMTKMSGQKVDASGDDTASIGDLGDILGFATQSPIASLESLEPLANPRALDSPARNTRSAKRETMIQMSGHKGKVFSAKKGGGDTASLGDLGDILESRRSMDVDGFNGEDTSSPAPAHEAMTNPRALDSPTQNTQKAKKETNILMSDNKFDASSEVKNENLTVSIGDLDDIIGSQNSFNKESTTESELSILSATEEIVLSQSASKMSKDDKVHRKSVGSEEMLVLSKVDTSEDDTTTIADIADILGTTKSMQVEHSPLRESPIAQSEKSDETASVADLADILYLSASTEDEESLASKNALKGGEHERLGESPFLQSSFRGTKDKTPERSMPAKSPMRLAPNSHVKPTPTKIEPSPRRVPNPMVLNSPARNTRSSKKKEKVEVVGTSAQKRSRKEENLSIMSTTSEFALREDEVTEGTSTKRHKLSYGSYVGIDKENQSIRSPMPGKNRPVGILSSKKRIRGDIDNMSSQRSVAFGSPEVAEYNIGSPSANFTPLPRSRAKELFTMTQTDTSGMSSTKPNKSVEETVEIETDLNILVDKITVDNMQESPALSPIANMDVSRINQGSNSSLDKSNDMPSSMDCSKQSEPPPNEETVELEGGIDHLLANASRKVDLPISEETVELEGGIDQLVLKMAASGDTLTQFGQKKENRSTRIEGSSPTDSSVDMTDAQSIASMNSRNGDKYTAELNIPLGAQRLDFSLHTLDDTAGDSESMDIDEGNTIELEGDMTSLLAAAGVKKTLNPGSKSYSQNDGTFNQTSPATVHTSLKKESESPVESIRFALSPGNSLKASSFEDILKSDLDDLSMSMSMSKQEPFEEEDASLLNVSGKINDYQVTLTFDEIAKASDLHLVEAPFGPAMRREDTMMVFNKSMQSSDSFTSEKWNQFLQLVCGEIEKQQNDLDGKASIEFSELVNSKPGRLAILQQKLRFDDNSAIREDLRALVESGKEKIEEEFDYWLAVVLKSFQAPLSKVSESLSQEKQTMDSASGKCTHFSTKLSFMAGRKVQRARRKSLYRRKVCP
jgi:hypothetical protein